MRIVHLVLGKANPDRANGVNGVAHALATFQARAGAEVSIWGITTTPRTATPAREYGLELFSAASSSWRLDRELERALASASDCIFHLHGGYHPEFHVAARALARRSIPWVFTPHGACRAAIVRESWIKKRLYLAWIDGFLLRHARAVHVFSPREARELEVYAPRARTVVLQNGVDLTQIRIASVPVDRAVRPVFGFCGRLHMQSKGLDLLLEGFARYVERGAPGELWLLGEGPDQAALLGLGEKLGLNGRVRFLGPQFGAEKRQLLSAMDVFLHPSRNEGMPLAVLEAAALGVPCVVSRDTNLGEAIEGSGAGIVLERNDPEEIASALERCAALHASGSLSGLGERGRTMVVEEFDWARIAVRSFAELYGMPAVSSTQAA